MILQLPNEQFTRTGVSPFIEYLNPGKPKTFASSTSGLQTKVQQQKINIDDLVGLNIHSPKYYRSSLMV